MANMPIDVANQASEPRPPPAPYHADRQAHFLQDSHRVHTMPPKQEEVKK